VTDLSRFLSLTDRVAIAHRGGSTLRPENTLTAFDHAIALGVDGLECDVHLSSDGDVVVIHDPTLNRTTNATGPVSALSARDLAGLDAGFHYGSLEGYPYRGRGIGVPTLRQLLDRYTTVPIVIEVKGDDPAVALRTIDVVRDARAEDRVVVAGFSQPVLEAARRKAPEIVTSAAFDEVAGLMSALEKGALPMPQPFKLFQVPFRFHGTQRLFEPFVVAARAAGLPVQAWIVDDPHDMRELGKWGVTGIISDRPDVAVEIVNAR
jgi:glycerophosphoryl diester phosphodiesterase